MGHHTWSYVTSTFHKCTYIFLFICSEIEFSSFTLELECFCSVEEVILICVWCVLKDVIEFLDPDHIEGKTKR